MYGLFQCRICPVSRPAYRGVFSALAVVILLGLGLGLIGWSVTFFLFLRHRTSVRPQGAPQKLFSEGPFRINRNPIYTGMFVLVLAFGLLGAGLSGLLLSVVFPLFITKFFIRHEEDLLRRHFPKHAEAYFRVRRRW